MGRPLSVNQQFLTDIFVSSIGAHFILFTINLIIYKFFKEKFIVAQLLLGYTPNILMN
jgi:hypothetical protein